METLYHLLIIKWLYKRYAIIYSQLIIYAISHIEKSAYSWRNLNFSFFLAFLTIIEKSREPIGALDFWVIAGGRGVLSIYSQSGTKNHE